MAKKITSEQAKKAATVVSAYAMQQAKEKAGAKAAASKIKGFFKKK